MGLFSFFSGAFFRFCVQQETEFYLHFDVKYTDREKEIFSDYQNFRDKATNSLRRLHDSIEARFKSLFYSDICNRRPLELETDYSGTHCRKFPINGVRFETVARNAEEDFTQEPNPALPEAPVGETPPDDPSAIASKDPMFEDVPF